MPSELLTKTVRTPELLACAMIAAGSPPLDLFTYQTHMPVPSSGPPPVALGRLAGRLIRIGPAAFDLRPRFAVTLIRPLLAHAGTVT